MRFRRLTPGYDKAHAAQRLRNQQATLGMSLLSVLISISIGIVVIMGAFQLWQIFQEDRSYVTAQLNTDSGLQTLLKTVDKLMKVRMIRVPPSGPGIPYDFTLSLLDPSPLVLTSLTVQCSGLTVRSRSSVSSSVISMTRIKTLCGANLTYSDALYQSMSDVANCPSGQRPVVAVETWPDETDAASSVTYFPPTAPLGATTAVQSKSQNEPIATQICFWPIRSGGKTVAVRATASSLFVTGANRPHVRNASRDFSLGEIVSEVTKASGDIEIREFGRTEMIR